MSCICSYNLIYLVALTDKIFLSPLPAITVIDTWIQHTLLGLHLLWLNELELHAPASPRDGSCVGRIVQKGDLDKHCQTKKKILRR